MPNSSYSFLNNSLNQAGPYYWIQNIDNQFFIKSLELAAMAVGVPIAVLDLINPRGEFISSSFFDGEFAEVNTSNMSILGEEVKGMECFAGFILTTKQNIKLGALWICSPVKFELTAPQKLMLEKVSEQIVETIELKLLNEKLSRHSALNADIRKMTLTGVWEVDLQSHVSLWSSEVFEIYGLETSIALSINEALKFFPEHEKVKISQLIEQAIGLGQSYDGEFEFIDANNIKKWIRAIGKPVIRDGQVVKLLGTYQDITQQKKNQIEMQLSNQYLELALEGASLGIWDWDLRTNAVKFDRRWASMLGLDINNIKMDLSTWESRVHPDDLPRCLEAIRAYMEGKTSFYENIHRMKHENGKWIYILDRGKISEWDQHGKPIRFNGTHLDVTDQKTLEQQLVEAQAISKIGSWYYNLQTQEQYWSSEHYKIFEIPEPQEQSALYQMYRDRIHPDDLKVLDNLLDRAFKHGEGFIYDHRVILGEKTKYVQGIGKVIKDEHGKPVAVSGTCRDRTADIERETKYQTLLDSISEGLVVQSESGEIIQNNPAALKILGLTEDQLLGRSSFDPRWRAIREDGSDFPGEEHPAIVALATKKPVHKVTMGLRLPNEEVRWISITSIPVLNAQGWHSLTTFSDITEIIQKTEENQFVLDTIGIGVWKYNLLEKSLHWDRSMYDLYDIDPKDFTGDLAAWESSLSPDAREMTLKDLELALKGEKDFNTTFEIITGKYAVRTIGSRAKVIRNEAGEPLIMFGINWDKTKEAELEHTLELERAKSLHQSKLATIGQLAAGVGHEINNPLAIIAGQIIVAEQMLRDAPKPDERVIERLKKIDHSVNRIANIVKGLRTFARSDDSQISYFNIMEPLQETFDMLKDIYEKEDVKLSLQTEGGIGYILGNRGRIQQVLINLISNAKDASEGKSDRWVRLEVITRDDEILIQVKDNGTGIREDLQDKIFEPFFTTKEPNKGTGIGLSLVHNILKEHQGRIELESRLAHGSTFTLVLPRKKQIISQIADLPKYSSDQRLPLKVMVVDDEEDLRDILFTILSRLCEHVVVWESGDKALTYLEKNSVDLILSDIKMPKMDGFEFFKKVRQNNFSEQPTFIFISGGIDMNTEQAQILNHQADGFWTKPFKLDEIQEKLKLIKPKR
jgi:PAS domain S-box-containing protein